MLFKCGSGEMADALASGASGGNLMGVQLPPSAPLIHQTTAAFAAAKLSGEWHVFGPHEVSKEAQVHHLSIVNGIKI